MVFFKYVNFKLCGRNFTQRYSKIEIVPPKIDKFNKAHNKHRKVYPNFSGKRMVYFRIEIANLDWSNYGNNLITSRF
jgi:hypothetical protein